MSSGASLFTSPSHTQLTQAEQLFTWLFSQNYTKKTQDLAATLGFSWHESARTVQLKDPLKNGIGEYFFNKKSKATLVLQAPHRYHDKYTGAIAKKLYKQGTISSIALNTLPRYTPSDQHDYGDFSRLKASMHTAYSLGFMAVNPNGKIIQLHGFDANKRRSATAQSADIILSNGTQYNTEYLLALQGCFENKGWHTARYPSQVKELGATKNAIGMLLRVKGYDAFHHIELNFETRKTLNSESNRRLEFLACLLEELK